MIFAFLSSRVRGWLLLGVAVPLVGRLLQRAGRALGDRRSGRALSQAGDLARGSRRGDGGRREAPRR